MSPFSKAEVDEFSKDVHADKMDRLGEHLRSADTLACVVVATSFIDSLLTTVLKRGFIAGNTTEKLLRHDGGVIGSMWARSALAYCMGIISKPCYTNIQVIAEVRNKFAHLVDEVAFDSPEIIACCDKLLIPVAPLTFSGPGFQLNAFSLWYGKSDARSKFCNVAMHVFFYLQWKAAQQTAPQTPDADKTRLGNLIWD